ncbi:HD domain-containing protein [Flavihumibacter rivuli]|uniref:HD domain-containing protein n=1 Tax=Flavihumibacter rivuli TaxID=2838156 RepID=UPI001BDE05A8|nr:HD domain-containing protein [Flavihumibacter rivuli]ULQ58277.1 HD domain-containing protein [Flavihumibacter rivuli]
MTESDFQVLKEEIVSLLKTGLDRRLTYHNLEHTLDVLQQSERIAALEKLSDPRQVMLLRIAALFHDTGFLYTYKGHEEKSCEIMESYLNHGSIPNADLEVIKGMIMATKIPQSPKTLAEAIICDADLDYLGRDDFPPISNGLKQEFLVFGVIKDEKDWDPLQIGFFEKHQYFTISSRNIRQPRKMEYLSLLKTRGSNSL